MTELDIIEMRKWCLMYAHSIDKDKYNVDAKPTVEELIAVAQKVEDHLMAVPSIG